MTTRHSFLFQFLWGTALVLPLSLGCTPGVASEPKNPPAAKAQPVNLIDNGDFSRGIAPWGAHTIGAPGDAPPQELRLVGGALCTTLHGGVQVVVGWPVEESEASVQIAQGKQYELSVEASFSGAVHASCVAKLGHRSAPYTAAAVLDLGLKNSSKHFRMQFLADHADERAGVAIECRLPKKAEPAELCLHRVALTLH